MEQLELDRQSRERAIGEAYTIKIKLGFLLTAVTTLITVIAIFISLRSDVLSLLGTVAAQQRVISEMQVNTIDLKLKIQSIDDSLIYLKESIEQDRKYHLLQR